MTLAAPPLPALQPELAAAPVLNGGPPVAQALQDLTLSSAGPPLADNAAGLLQGVGGNAGGAEIVSGGVNPQAQSTEASLPGMPELGGATAGSVVWLTSGGLVLQSGPWGWLQQAEGAAWTPLGKSYRDLYAQAQSAAKFAPLGLSSQSAGLPALTGMPAGANVSSNLWAKWGAVTDFLNGMEDQEPPTSLSDQVNNLLLEALNLVAPGVAH